MPLKATTKLPFGNARRLRVLSAGETPEIRFTPDPAGGPECCWFCFRLVETEPRPGLDGQVRIVLEHFANLPGGNRPAACIPVYRPQGQGWSRLTGGHEQLEPDGQVSACWEVPYPSPAVDVAFCYPYGPEALQHLVSRTKGYWQQDVIGVSQQGRELVRLRNGAADVGGRAAGVYLVARQHAGETPGSWVLDGLLQSLASSRKHHLLVWAAPFADIDGVMTGAYGKDRYPWDLDRAWSRPCMRHETRVLAGDMLRWKERCRPALVLDLHAPGACDTDGVYCCLPGEAACGETATAAAKFTKVLRDVLSADYAAEPFTRAADESGRWPGWTLQDFACRELGVPALKVQTPYASAGKTLLSPKRYRDIGRSLAAAMIQKFR
jgi:hypothetical protein